MQAEKHRPALPTGPIQASLRAAVPADKHRSALPTGPMQALSQDTSWRRRQSRSPGPGTMSKDVLAQRSPRKQAHLQVLRTTRPAEPPGQGQLIVEDIGNEARPKGGHVSPPLGRPLPLQPDAWCRQGIEGHGRAG